MSDLPKSSTGVESTPVNLALEVNSQQANITTKTFEDDIENDLSIRKAYVCCSAANLGSVTVGPGMLSLPAVFAMVGWLTGSIIMIVGALGAWSGLHLLSELAHRIGGTRTSFGKAAAKGGLAFVFLADLAVLINQLLAGVPYIMVLGDLLPVVVRTINPDVSIDSILLSRQFWISVVMWGMCFPLCLLPTINALRFTSIMAMGSVAYIGILAIIYFASPPVAALDPCAGIAGVCTGPIEATRPLSTAFFKVLSTFFFAFNCHPLIFNIYNEVREPSVRYMDKVLALWGSFVSTLYAGFGLFGYFTYGNTVSSNVLMIWPSSTPAMIAHLGLCFTVTVSMPLLMQAARIVIMHIANLCFTITGREEWTKPTHTSQTWPHWVSYALHLSFSYLVALFVTDLGIVFSIIGATGVALTCYIVPGFMYWKLFKDDRKERVFSSRETFVLYAALGMGIFGVVYIPTIGTASIIL